MLSFLWIYVMSDRFQQLALIRLAESIFLPKVNKNWGSTWYGLHVWDTVGNGVFSGGPFNLSMCACMNAWKFASLVKNVTQEKPVHAPIHAWTHLFACITHAGMPEQLKSGHLGVSAGGVMASKAPLAGSAKSGRSNREPEPSCQRMHTCMHAAKIEKAYIDPVLRHSI